MDKVLEKITEGIGYSFLTGFLEEPSKRIRSHIAILYLKTCNKELSTDIYKILAAGELIHNASLLHDDVIDDAELRRGKTTIGKTFSYKLSIVGGDYLISEAISKILELNNKEVLEIFQKATKSMCEGEINQFFLREKLPTREEYLDICIKKTGVLFSAILESVAVIAGLKQEQARRFGELFGVCFQIRNDLDFVSAAADKKNNIFTAKDVLGIENTLDLLDNYKEEMKSILGVFPESAYKRELEDLIDL